MAAPIPVQRRTSPKTCALVTSATAARGGKTVKFVASSAGPFDGFPDDEYVSSRILGVAMRLDPGAKMLPAPPGATKGVYCAEPATGFHRSVGLGLALLRETPTHPGDAPSLRKRIARAAPTSEVGPGPGPRSAGPADSEPRRAEPVAVERGRGRTEARSSFGR